MEFYIFKVSLHNYYFSNLLSSCVSLKEPNLWVSVSLHAGAWVYTLGRMVFDRQVFLCKIRMFKKHNINYRPES